MESPAKEVLTEEEVPSTPLASTSDPLSSLLSDFTGLGLESLENMKRSADRMTVEGSPVNTPLHSNKRLDASKTPHPSQLLSSAEHSSPAWKECARTLSLPLLDAPQRVLVISSGSDDHDTGLHQENARRTALLVGPEGCLRRPQLGDALVWAAHDGAAQETPPAPFADLLRVHEFTYLKHMGDKCRAAGRQEAAIAAAAAAAGGAVDASAEHGTVEPSTLPPFYAPLGMLDTDTPLAPKSLEAATRFCGAAMWAVDYLLDAASVGDGAPEEASGVGSNRQRASRVFVVGRPPGHHAGPYGCVPSPSFFRAPGMTSSGFCLLNTVAVAAAYARYKYGRLALLQGASGSSSSSSSGDSSRRGRGVKPRIAIIDIDIHHGNGTEAIVRNLSPSLTPLPLPSSWAPQYTPSYKPWLDESDPAETFFGSIHLYAGELFYPCSGADEVSAHKAGPEPCGANVVNVALTPLGPGPWDPRARAKLTPAQLRALNDAASAELRAKVAKMLLPALHAFEPTLLFISAGFDAHSDDLYHFLSEKDFHWLTEQLCRIADMHGAKVVSVLEGGYSLAAPTKEFAQASKVRGKKAPVEGDEEGSEGRMFAQQPGDGGLVKGVLAHVSALAGRGSWGR